MPAFQTIVVPVRDLAAAKAVYAAVLGAQPHTDGPYDVGFSVDGCELGLNPGGFDQGQTAPVAYVDVEDITATVATVATLVESGASVVQERAAVGGGTSLAVLADPDGNRFGLRSHAG